MTDIGRLWRICCNYFFFFSEVPLLILVDREDSIHVTPRTECLDWSWQTDVKIGGAELGMNSEFTHTHYYWDITTLRVAITLKSQGKKIFFQGQGNLKFVQGNFSFCKS